MKCSLEFRGISLILMLLYGWESKPKTNLTNWKRQIGSITKNTKLKTLFTRDNKTYSYEEGQYTLDSNYFGKVDTSLTSCPPQKVILERKYLLLKNGEWTITTPGGERYFGNYLKGKKDGTWTKIDFRNVKSQIE